MTDDIAYFFQKIDQIPARIYDGICSLIASGGGVGTRHMHENLQNAFLIGYALSEDQVVGTSTHKNPKPDYREKIEKATGLDLKGFLERGYTAVRSDFRGRGIGGALIRGLIEKSPDLRVYVTIRMDNTPALKMTHKEQMIHAATFVNNRTGHELGVFTNIQPGWINPS
ncbi:MAG: GNAT family N-acetyltransferase [Deltaproteobacteria bacterium]|nr:GNAT family N-acetyltransferase [Deltaproteobacteria bacterium]